MKTIRSVKTVTGKKHIFITALITFVVTTFLVLFAIGGGLLSVLWSSIDSDGVDKIKKVEALMDTYFIYDYDKEKMEDYALTGYTHAAGDPYTAYIDKEAFEDMRESVEGDYVGIGIEVFIDKDNLITVIAPFDNSPAQKAGILPGDKIVMVGETPVDISNYNEAISLIRGVPGEAEGTGIELTVKREEQTFPVVVSREKIVAVTATEKMLANDVGYVRISNFGDKTAVEFARCLESVKNKGARYMVVDLRNNPGGTLESVVAVADMLLPEGNIITIKDKTGEEVRYDSEPTYFDIPLCVIINGNSASAAEALAGAIADSGRGTLVGEKSFGKGSVQTIFELGDGTAVKITSAKYYTPGGTCIDKTGIVPAIQVSLDEDVENYPVTTIPYSKDTQLQKAIEFLLKNY